MQSRDLVLKFVQLPNFIKSDTFTFPYKRTRTKLTVKSNITVMVLFNGNRRLGVGFNRPVPGKSSAGLLRWTYGVQRLVNARNFSGLGYIHSDSATSWLYSILPS